MANETCGACQHWRHDETNAQDRKMTFFDRKPCSLATDAHARSRFYHSSTKACRAFSAIKNTVRHIG